MPSWAELARRGNRRHEPERGRLEETKAEPARATEDKR
jgi:hypothetical protein